MECNLNVQDVFGDEWDIRTLTVQAYVTVGQDVGSFNRHFASPPSSSSSCFLIRAALR